MGKKILIDLITCRECKDCMADCAYNFHPDNKGIIALMELAAFAVSCRKCQDAPCIEVCPAEALEKTENNLVVRAVNLCVACKSCVTICPFGTLLNDLFESRKSICDYCELNGNVTDLLCIRTCPEGALRLTDEEENPAENIYQINDKVLVRDYKWE
ncbi:MAG: 4Fe-4S binding protein, partial [Cyclobacteriaceae bacterium]|nr:4Fe-4S binding protein [Cyclobacteriaceae bacterium]